MKSTPSGGSLTRRGAIEVLMGLGAFGASRQLCEAATDKPPPPEPDATGKVAKQAVAWLTLPPTPPLPQSARSGLADFNQTRIYFAQFGQGPPVLMLHGGLGNSTYWGHQIEEVAKHYSVTVMDTRGHGRSPVTSRDFSFELFANDVSALLDFLGLSSVAVVGWSDGAITGLQLALNQEKRVREAVCLRRQRLAG